jgi:hypothetical protein
MEAHLDVTSRHDCEKSDSWPDYAVNSWPVQVVKNVPQQKDGYIALYYNHTFKISSSYFKY